MRHRFAKIRSDHPKISYSMISYSYSMLKNFLFVGKRKEPILGYVPKNDEKKKRVQNENG